jgi:uncharacterized membrane protein
VPTAPLDPSSAVDAEALRAADRRRTTALTAAVTGVATAAYYATPDVIRSRAGRGWATAALATVAAAAAVPGMQADLADRRASGQSGSREETLRALQDLPTRHKVVLAAAGTAFVGVQLALTVAAERWVFRRGEARAAAGRRFAHSGPALLYGAVAAGLVIAADAIPTPDDVETLDLSTLDLDLTTPSPVD